MHLHTSITWENSLDFRLRKDEKLENNLPACWVVDSNNGDSGGSSVCWLLREEDPRVVCNSKIKEKVVSVLHVMLAFSKSITSPFICRRYAFQIIPKSV